MLATVWLSDLKKIRDWRCVRVVVDAILEEQRAQELVQRDSIAASFRVRLEHLPSVDMSTAHEVRHELQRQAHVSACEVLD